jgi:mono/diheme cytochrome c family protein
MAAKPAPRKRRLAWFMLLVGMLIGIIATLLSIAFVVMPAALRHRQDLPFERDFSRMAIDLAVKNQAGTTENPLADSSRALTTGRLAYTGSCAVCHGVNGDGRGSFALALYPPATNLQLAATQAKTDAELYWIIKNGLSFVGMPAFGDRYDDARIWSLVAYTRSLGDAERRRGAEEVPIPTDEHLVNADPAGDAAQRGAAVYFAQGCYLCHGARGRSTGNLNLRGSQGANEAIRKGVQGMPVYGTAQISEAELRDLIEYLRTFARSEG